jgi:hypothetical protein
MRRDTVAGTVRRDISGLTALIMTIAVLAVVIPTCTMLLCAPFGHGHHDASSVLGCGGEWFFSDAPLAMALVLAVSITVAEVLRPIMVRLAPAGLPVLALANLPPPPPDDPLRGRLLI